MLPESHTKHANVILLTKLTYTTTSFFFCTLLVVRNSKLVYNLGYGLSVMSLSTASTATTLEMLVLNPLELPWKNAQSLNTWSEYEVKH